MISRVEAMQIAKVIGSADSGCRHCVNELAEKFNELDLGWRFVTTKKDLLVRPEWDDEYRLRWVYVKVEPKT